MTSTTIQKSFDIRELTKGMKFSVQVSIRRMWLLKISLWIMRFACWLGGFTYVTEFPMSLLQPDGEPYRMDKS